MTDYFVMQPKPSCHERSKQKQPNMEEDSGL